MPEEKWIQEAIRHPGYLTEAAKREGGWDEEHGRIKREWLEKQAHSRNPHRRRAAHLALNLRRLRRED